MILFLENEVAENWGASLGYDTVVTHYKGNLIYLLKDFIQKIKSRSNIAFQWITRDLWDLFLKNNLNLNLTLLHFKQSARNFFISTSFPGKSFSERCVRCLKGFVSTTFKRAGELSKIASVETNCSKNLWRESVT